MMKRPAGITIIAILSLVAGIIYAVQGLRILGTVVFGPAQVWSNATVWGGLTLLLGLIWISVGSAFLSLKPWAWLFGVIIVGFSLIEAFFVQLSNGENWQLGDMLFATIIPLVILLYLNSEKVKAAFVVDG